MKLDRVDVSTTDQKVKIHSTQPKLELHSTEAKVDIKQPAATLEISTEAAKLLIDQSQARRDIGLISPKESIEQAAQEGMQAVKEGTERRAREGWQMMQISSHQNQIAAIAKSKIGIEPVRSTIKWIPSIGSVKSTYVPAEVDINITPHKPKIDATLGDVKGQYTPGDVTGTTVQRASVETTVIKGE